MLTGRGSPFLGAAPFSSGSISSSAATATACCSWLIPGSLGGSSPLVVPAAGPVAICGACTKSQQDCQKRKEKVRLCLSASI